LSLISQTQSLRLYGGLNSQVAVDIKASDSAGGVNIMSGIGTGSINLISGSGGIHNTTSNGNITLTANNGSGSFTVNSQSNNQDLLFNLTGSTDSQLRIESSGNNATKTALYINATNTAGNIQISTANGLGTGSLTQLVGSGGFTTVTNTAGPVSITSQGAPSSYVVTSSGQDQNLTLSMQNPTNSSIIIQSEGIQDAIQLATTNTAGSIKVNQPPLSSGSVDVVTGYGGFSTTTQTGGSIQMTAYGATSSYTNATTEDNQNLTVRVSGNTDSKVIITSSGTGQESVRVEATNASSGILLTANGVVKLESQSLTSGVQIATGTPAVPVKIGTSDSTTTIYGNLDVKGITTTIESTVVTVDDNIIVVNNAPSSTSDGGLAVKRFQSANNTGAGDVVLDTPDETGMVQNGGNTLTTLKLDSTASNVDNAYAGWWVKITSGTGANQVRRIKSYVGGTRIATIYSTTDQTDVLGDPSPVEGLNFSTIPDTTSEYALFPCHYVMMIWDESHNEFAFICSNKSPSDEATLAHYSDLHIDNLITNGITCNTINGAEADITTTVTLNDSNTLPVTISAFPRNYGVYMVFIKPSINSTRAQAIFMIGRVDVSSTPGTVVRIISVKGAQYDQLDMQWPANGNPQLLYRPNPIGGIGSTTFKIKIVSL
jgi:hypothetical protein